MNSFLLADIRTTDTWDLGEVVGAVVLVALVVAIVLVGRVIRRR